jgi:molybdopterin-guanine dinucleotide biosynthesis protein A
MNILSENITGLILAGGRGQRVDEQDKGLLCLHGKPMVEHQLEWFSKQLMQVIISANRNIESYLPYGVPVLEDLNLDEKFPGPLEGVLRGLKASFTEWIYVQPVDMPMMPNNVIELLCCKINKRNKAYFLRTPERSHYLSMLLSQDAIPELTTYLAQGGKRVRGFLDKVNAEAVDLGINEKCFSNFNELSDYSK